MFIDPPLRGADQNDRGFEDENVLKLSKTGLLAGLVSGILKIARASVLVIVLKKAKIMGDEDGRKVFVGNLSYDTREDDLRSHFESVIGSGEVETGE